MDEEQNFDTTKGATTRQGPVRPSMVVMTSKLLHVSEGIAAMNLRIAAGVVFCMILLVATFVVNVVAFDYAKSEKVEASAEGIPMVVDKGSGEVIDHHTSFIRMAPEVNLAELSKLRTVDIYNGEYKSSYLVFGVQEAPCDSTEQEDLCFEGSKFDLVGPNDMKIHVAKANEELQGYGVKAVYVTPDMMSKSNRHLLQETGAGCGPGCWICCTNGGG